MEALHLVEKNNINIGSSTSLKNDFIINIYTKKQMNCLILLEYLKILQNLIGHLVLMEKKIISNML